MLFSKHFLAEVAYFFSLSDNEFNLWLLEEDYSCVHAPFDVKLVFIFHAVYQKQCKAFRFACAAAVNPI